MWLFLAALLLGALKTLTYLEMLDLPWAAAMSWWWVLGAFALTAAWWAWADYSGLSARKAEDRMDARKAARLARQKENLGLRSRKR